MPSEIDEPSAQAAASDSAAWLTYGAGTTMPPVMRGQIAVITVRIRELVANANAVRLGVDVRLDALIYTRAADGTARYATWTRMYTDIQEGQRLALENGLLYWGPVRDFVDIALFVSCDRIGSPDLEILLAEHAGSVEFRESSAARQVTAGAVGEPSISAVGGNTALAGMTRELLRNVAGESIGVYRTSYCHVEQFRVDVRLRESLHRTLLLPFSLVVESAEQRRS